MGNNNLPTLNDAIALAVALHSGQQRLDGSPYILHPLRVMLKFDNWALQVVAVLHDVVEDCDITLEGLSNMGYPKKVLKAIDALTKRDGEEYMEYVHRAAENDLARAVKLADLHDNHEPEIYPSMAPRYEKAMAYIAAVEAELRAG